jgi:hypothetical protein
MHSLTIHSLDLDRRLLSGLDRDAFDSTAVWLQSRFTDAVIEQSLRAMPAEYHYTIPQTAAILRARRDELRTVAVSSTGTSPLSSTSTRPMRPTGPSLRSSTGGAWTSRFAAAIPRLSTGGVSTPRTRGKFASMSRRR